MGKAQTMVFREAGGGEVAAYPPEREVRKSLPPTGSEQRPSACQQEISNHFSDTKATGMSCLSVGDGLRDQEEGTLIRTATQVLSYVYSHGTLLPSGSRW